MEIPRTNNCILAINIDMRNKKEHIIIGSHDNIEKRSSRRKFRTIESSINPIGTFVNLFTSEYKHKQGWFDINFLSRALEKGFLKDNWYASKMYAQKNFLEDAYRNGNVAEKYIAIKVWERYNRDIKKSERLKRKSEELKNLQKDFLGFIERLNLPFRIPSKENVFEAQGSFYWDSYKPSMFFADHFDYDLGMMISRDDMRKTYVYVEDSIIPLIYYYILTLNENHLYFRTCVECGEVFLADKPMIKTLCSKWCRDKRKKKIKENYDLSIKNDDFEREHRNTNMFFNNKINKVKESVHMGVVSPEKGKSIVEKLEKAKKSFQMEGRKQKKMVKEGQLIESAYIEWLNSQKEEADRIMYEWRREKKNAKKRDGNL